jgi:hypothetical protein
MAMTGAERQARYHAKRQAEIEKMRRELEALRKMTKTKRTTKPKKENRK